MKKSIIAAGAVSVALAAMPVVGAFATTTGGPFTDVIQTTIGETCTFARGTLRTTTPSLTDNHPDGNWTADTTTPTPDPNKEILTAATVTPAAPEATIGSSKFNVICNDTDGYQVTIGTNPLKLPAGVTQVHDWDYATAANTSSYWRVETTDSSATGYSADLANNIVSKKTSAVDGDGHEFIVTYKAYAEAGQDAGTYSANVTYTFANLGS